MEFPIYSLWPLKFFLTASPLWFIPHSWDIPSRLWLILALKSMMPFSGYGLWQPTAFMLIVCTLIPDWMGTLPGLNTFCNAELYPWLTTEHEHWCALTIHSKFLFIGGLGVGLGVISIELPAWSGILATWWFNVQACQTTNGIWSTSSMGMTPCKSKNPVTPVRTLWLPLCFRHTLGSVLEHKGDIWPFTWLVIQLHLPHFWILLVGIPLISIACRTCHWQKSFGSRDTAYPMQSLCNPQGSGSCWDLFASLALSIQTCCIHNMIIPVSGVMGSSEAAEIQCQSSSWAKSQTLCMSFSLNMKGHSVWGPVQMPSLDASP